MVPIHSEDFIPFMETKSRYRYMLLCRHTEHLRFDCTMQISENARPMCAFYFFDFTEKTMRLQTCGPITMHHWRCSRTKKIYQSVTMVVSQQIMVLNYLRLFPFSSFSTCMRDNNIVPFSESRTKLQARLVQAQAFCLTLLCSMTCTF